MQSEMRKNCTQIIRIAQDCHGDGLASMRFAKPCAESKHHSTWRDRDKPIDSTTADSCRYDMHFDRVVQNAGCLPEWTPIECTQKFMFFVPSNFIQYFLFLCFMHLLAHSISLLLIILYPPHKFVPEHLN